MKSLIRSSRQKQGTKQGAAAIYVVIFTTLILSIITISFIRIMTSDVTNTVNDDLSTSAYDSALAGIEDAKVALMKYHNCVDKNSTTGDCAFVADMQANIASGNCDTVATALGRAITNESVVIQESTNISDSNNSAGMLQAYTCVKISEELTDYRGTLDSTNRTIVVPLRTNTGDYGQVQALKIMWHPQDMTNKTAFSNLPPKNQSLIPALTADIFQTANSFNLGTISAKSGNMLDFASLFLRPASYSSSTAQNVRTISKADVLAIADKDYNAPFDVSCTNAAFMCTAVINLPVPAGSAADSYPTTRNPSTFFLRLALPYANDSGTEFSVTMCKKANCEGATGLSNDGIGSDKIAPFVGVQAQVDSTGRANDIYRRVEARIELVDTGFPYPEYAVWMAGTDQKDINKAFWVTNECRTKKDSASDFENCDNKGNL